VTRGYGGSEIVLSTTPGRRFPREGSTPGRRNCARTVASRHSGVHQVPGPAPLWPVHPRRRTDLAPHQAWYPNDGWRSHHGGRAPRVRRGPSVHSDTPDCQRRSGAVPDGRAGARGLPGRLS